MKDFWSNFAPVILGTLLGAFAHFGRMIHDEGWPPFRRVIGFLMQLGLIALLAAAVATQFNITSDLARCLTASMLTVAANEVLTWFRTKASRFLVWLDHKPTLP